jgi:hypothetical protein
MPQWTHYGKACIEPSFCGIEINCGSVIKIAIDMDDDVLAEFVDMGRKLPDTRFTI